MRFSYKLLLLSVMMILLASFEMTAFAAEITLQEAIEAGLNNNSDILDAKDNLVSIERELKQLQADDDWHLDLNVDSYAHELDLDDELSDVEFSITGSKTYWGGLTLESELYGSGDYSSQEDLSDDETGLKLKLSQDLYPRIANQSEQSYIKTQLDLQAAKSELEEEKQAKIITWIRDYLNLLRLKEKYEVAVKKNELALNNFKEVNDKKRINEASEIDILTAQIELEESQYNLKEADNNYQQAKKSFYHQLKLENQDELVLSGDSKYLVMLEEMALSQEINFDDQAKLLDLSSVNSVDLLKNKLQQDSIRDDLEWSKAEDKPNLDLTGSYDSVDQDWGVGLSLSYNLFDSGKQKLAEEDLEAELNSLEREHNDLIRDLSLDLEEIIDQIRLTETKLGTKKLSLSKTKLEKKIAEEQLARGLIDKWELKEKKLALREAEINQKEVEDELLVNKLELIKLLGMGYFEGGNKLEKIN
ncbi:TolC family protein [Orenia marismortui]|uniref:TolC family protein n=1 Tax=Orenia marismortui TaxID=46469 RepID=UPI00037DBAF7|nr:TolC family protein [Orenia marismortui]